MSTRRARGREKPVVGIAATRCNISTFVFVICPMLDWDHRVARVRMTGFRPNLPPFDQLTPDVVNLENGKI